MRLYKRIEFIRCLYCTHSFHDPEVGYDCAYNCCANYCDKFECDEANFNRLVADARDKVFGYSVTRSIDEKRKAGEHDLS